MTLSHAARSASLQHGPGIDSRTDLSYEEFVRGYVARERPVVIKGAVGTDTVTPTTLLVACGHRPLTDLRGGGGASTLVRGTQASVDRLQSFPTLGVYLTCFQDDGAELPYLTNLSVSANFPELLTELAAPAYFRDNWLARWPFTALTMKETDINGELFIAPRGATYGRLHYDRHAVFVGTCQYFGTKTWWVCPRDESRHLYPVASGYAHQSPVDPFAPDLDRFPAFARVKGSVVTLEAGDAMFLPSSWWHATRAVTPNISSVHRIMNRHNVWRYLWELRHYLAHDWGSVAFALRRMMSNR